MKTKTCIEELSQHDTKLTSVDYSFVISNHDPLHIERKQQQRAISDVAINICLAYGQKRRAIQAWNYTITDRCLKGTIYEKYIGALRGLTIIGNWEESVFNIITSYWDFKIKSRNRY